LFKRLSRRAGAVAKGCFYNLLIPDQTAGYNITI
jgi:hypothetical protein